MNHFGKKNDKHCKIIDKYFEKYNHIRAHTGLEKTKNGNLKRQKDVFYDETLMWQRNFNWEYLVDSAITGFQYNKEKENQILRFIKIILIDNFFLSLFYIYLL